MRNTTKILVLVLFCLFLLTSVQGQGQFIPPVPLHIHEALIFIGIPSAEIYPYYQALTQGLGNSVQSITGIIAGNARASRLMGLTLTTRGQHSFLEALGTAIRTIPDHIKNKGARKILPYLRNAGNFSNIVQEGGFTNQALTNLAQTAQRYANGLRSVASGVSATTTAEAGIIRQVVARAASFFSYIKVKFSNLVAWSSESILFQMTGYMAIAGATWYAIQMAQKEYIEQMESLGNAAEVEAFNNNVRLLLDAYKNGKLALSKGMTLGDAIKRLGQNMRNGGKIFGGILPDSDSGLEPGLEPEGSTKKWVRVETRINPDGFPQDFGKKPGGTGSVSKFGTNNSNLYWEYRWEDRRLGTLKDVKLTFAVKNPPEEIQAGVPAKFVLEGEKKNNINKPSAEACSATIRIPSIKRDIGSLRMGPEFGKGKRTFTFTVPSSFPDKFEIHFYIGKTAAYIVWVYSKR